MQGLDKYIGANWLPNLSAEEYYGMKDRLGASRLKAFFESPLHYHRFEDAGDTPSLRMGRMIHKMVLEYEEFFDDYIVQPSEYKTKNSKGYKDWLSLQDPNREVITEREFGQASEMLLALKGSYVGKYVENGLAETSVLWDWHSAEGMRIRCKGRLDYLIQQESKVDLIVDYKTCTSAKPSDVLRSMGVYKYWLQECHYVSGYRKAFKGDRDARIMFLFQETKSPYDVCAVMVDQESFELGMQRYEELMEELVVCRVEERYPGRTETVLSWGFQFG